jgi:exoribonuclease R
MPASTLSLNPTTGELVAGFDRVRTELGVPGAFPEAVRAEAAGVARPTDGAHDRVDRTDLPLVTVDPAGSRDLDQAMHIEATGAGHRVWYAIADVGAFVRPTGALDAETWARGVTYYCPDRRSPLHPDELGEGAASLLPDATRPALLWQIDLDGNGEAASASLRRAIVRSRRAWSYPELQQALDDGSAPDPLTLLRTVGQQRLALERQRHGIDLNLPEQEVVAVDGRYELVYRAPLAVEAWNAQISLLTGMEAARLMLAGRVGILRTLPPPWDRTLRAIRRSARALGYTWSDGTPWTAFLASVDRTTAHGAALVTQAARALRGAGYVAFDGDPPEGAAAAHNGVAAPYAHVTAPLRRLVDRYANEVVVSLCAGTRPPQWCLDRLADLPKEMDRAQQREHALNRAVLDYVEAMVLRHRVGEDFDATVTDVDDRGAVIQIVDPAVLTRLDATPTPPLGAELRVRLEHVDPDTRTVAFVESPGPPDSVPAR